MDRSKLAFIIGIALLVLQSTHGAELNSEATLNCNGKEFKCVNLTHYQPCSLTERAGQESQYMINGEILPCASEVRCNDEDSVGCALARSAQPVPIELTPVRTVSVDEVPVKADVVAEVPVKTDVVAEVVAETPAVKSIAVDTPVDIVPVEVRAVEEVVVEKVSVSSTEKPVEKVVEQAVVVSTVAPAVDSAKSAAVIPAKKRKIAKFSPKRLIKGFRAASWRPRVSLESQKDVVDSLRKRIFERRNKYESFVNIVLGKASPVKQSVAPVKQPAPGAPLNDDYDEESEGENEPEESGEYESPSDECMNESSGCDYDNGDDGGDDDDDECDDDDDDCDDDDDDECDDDDDDDELEPGEGEAVWEEEEVEGGIEIIEECPDDDEDECDDECDDDDDDDEYEWEDGVVEESEGGADDDCDEEEDCCDEDCDCDDDDEECKKKRKQFAQKKKNKNKKKKKTSNKKKTSSKQSTGNKSSSKNKDKKQTNQKKKVRYPAIQKIRKSLGMGRRSRATNSTATARLNQGGGQGGESHPIKDIASAIGNGVLNRVDGLLSIKDNGLFGNKNQQDDEDTGCTIIEGWECPRLGKYAHPVDCQRYVKCSLKGKNTVFECEEDEAYDPDQRECTTDWSSCDALDQCLYHRQLIEDPSDESGYFICIKNQNKFKESYTLYRRQCTEHRLFDPDYQLCIDECDYESIKKAKKRRQQIKKQKKCSKRKGNKSGKKKKSQKKH